MASASDETQGNIISLGEEQQQQQQDDSVNQKRLQLREGNLSANVSRPDISLAKLDGSIKKNTGFIKKLKAGVTAGTLETLKKEMMTLKLEKYIEEVATTMGEGIYRNSADIIAAIELSSLLHQRFSGFTSGFVDAMMKQFSSSCLPNPLSSDQSEKEEAARISKLRSSLRMLTEMYLVGLADDSLVPKAGPQQPKTLIPYMLYAMMVKDLKLHQNLPIILTFVRFFGSIFLPVRNGEVDKPVPEESLTLPSSFGIGADIHRDTQKLTHGYFDSLKSHLVKEHKSVRQMEKSNHDYFIAKGEAFEDRQNKYEKALKSFEKLQSSAQTLATILQLEMPELKEEEQIVRIGIGISDAKSEVKEANTGIWEDEETKSFYEHIYDLQIRVPPIILGMRVEPPTENEQGKENDESDNAQPPPESSEEHKENRDEEDGMSPADELKNEDIGGDEDEPNISNRGLLKTLLESLQNALNRDTVDELAVQLALINSKGMRKKLVQALLAVPRQRPELLPYYSRLIATMNPYMPDVGSGVMSGLESEFKYRQRKKEQVLIEEKLKNIRFIGELTKFKVASYYTAFHCIKILLDDFSHHNIDLLCAFLETCGRYLYRTQETHVRMSNFLEILNRKKNVQNLESRHALMIENVIYECNPPDTPASTKKLRTPLEQFLRKIIYEDLCKDTAKTTLKLLRKMNWDDPEIRHMIQKIFFKIHKIKFSNLSIMAFMLAELCRYYPDFGIDVVDNTLEEIRIELERNIFKHNQRRLSTITFLGELYNYRMVTHKVIFETLYILLRFGHPNNIPLPGVECPLDAPNDFFRLRLCCKLLDVCGPGLGKSGSRARKLDHFLSFMQMYMFTKTQMPMEAEFFITDTLELIRPNLKLFATYEDAVAEVNRIALAQMRDGGAESDDEDQPDDQEAGAAGEMDGDIGQDESISGDDSDDAGDSDDEGDVYEEDEEDVVVHLEEAEEEDDDEFDREYSRLMQESLESRRNEKRSNFLDEVTPSHKWAQSSTNVEDEDIEEGTVRFTVLTRKGNKQQAKFMALPSDSSLAITTLAKKEEELAERAQLKELTLNYEQSQREQAMQETAGQSTNSRTGRRVILSTSSQRRANR